MEQALVSHVAQLRKAQMQGVHRKCTKVEVAVGHSPESRAAGVGEARPNIPPQSFEVKDGPDQFEVSHVAQCGRRKLSRVYRASRKGLSGWYKGTPRPTGDDIAGWYMGSPRPTDYSVAGWYMGSPRPTGYLVVRGHVSPRMPGQGQEAPQLKGHRRGLFEPPARGNIASPLFRHTLKDGRIRFAERCLHIPVASIFLCGCSPDLRRRDRGVGTVARQDKGRLAQVAYAIRHQGAPHAAGTRTSGPLTTTRRRSSTPRGARLADH